MTGTPRMCLTKDRIRGLWERRVFPLIEVIEFHSVYIYIPSLHALMPYP
jgi:hypothetical protein